MSTVDLNQVVTTVASDAHAVMQRADATLVSAQTACTDLTAKATATLESLNTALAAITAVANALQSNLSAALTFERDADNVIKSIHLKWPLT